MKPEGAPPGTVDLPAQRDAPSRWAFLTHLARQHPALLGTLGYLFLTAVGMSYEFQFFDQFNVNIFDYADASDFVLVALRKPLLLMITLVSIALLRNLFRAHHRGLRRSRWYRELSARIQAKQWYPLFERACASLIVVIYFGTLSGAYAEHSARQIKDGRGAPIYIELMSEAASGTASHGPTRYLPLGTTSRYVLVFNPANGHTDVLPVGNISRITLDITGPVPGTNSVPRPAGPKP